MIERIAMTSWAAMGLAMTSWAAMEFFVRMTKTPVPAMMTVELVLTE
jgi:hypothetical protein